MALQWKAAEHVSASVRTEGVVFFGLAYRLIFVHTYTEYVCMSCAKVLHKHIYEEGEFFF